MTAISLLLSAVMLLLAVKVNLTNGPMAHKSAFAVCLLRRSWKNVGAQFMERNASGFLDERTPFSGHAVFGPEMDRLSGESELFPPLPASFGLHFGFGESHDLGNVALFVQAFDEFFMHEFLGLVGSDVKHSFTIRKASASMPRAHRPPKPPSESLGSRLRKVRVAFGDAQQDIATKLGITRSSVSQWENDTVMPTVDKVEVMALRYSLPFEWLMFGRGDEPTLPTPGRRRRQSADTARSELFMGPMILECRPLNANEPSPEWHIPGHALPCNASDAVFFKAPADLPPIMHGDYVLIDKSQRELQLTGQWLVELTGSAHPMLVRSRVAKAHDRPIIEVISHDDVVFGLRSIKNVIGRVVARYSWL